MKTRYIPSLLRWFSWTHHFLSYLVDPVLGFHEGLRDAMLKLWGNMA